MLPEQQNESFASTSTATTPTLALASTRPSQLERQRSRPRRTANLLLASIQSRASCAGTGKGKEREVAVPSSCRMSLTLRCLGITALVLQLPMHGSAAAATKEAQHAFLHAPQQEERSAALLLARSSSLNISQNRPLQLVVIIGSIIFFVMLVTTLACFFRTPKSKKAAALENDEKNMTRGDWMSSVAIDPLADIYTTIDLDGKTSSRSGADGGGREKKNRWLQSSSFGPFSPAPLLKSEKEADGFFGPIHLGMERSVTQAPPQAAAFPYDRRFASSAALERIKSDDLELAGSRRLSRRPSFIDRALAIRTSLNDGRQGNARQQSDSYITQEPMMRSPKDNRDNNKKASGSAILSAISGTFPASFRGSRENTKRQHPIESDYEGTIGGKDGEIPMARRLRPSQARFPCDASTVIESPEVNSPYMDDRFSPLPNRCVGDLNMTPRTPGLAGVGTTWGNVAVVPVPPMARRVASFADLQREALCSEESNRMQIQASIDDWVRSSKGAARPPLSRGNTDNSFLSVASSAQFLAAKSRYNRSDSIRSGGSNAPPAAPGSWLSADCDAKDFNSIIGEYMVEDSAASDIETKSQVSTASSATMTVASFANTGHDRKGGNLREPVQPLPHRNSDGLVTGLTQAQRQKSLMMERGRAMSADACSPAPAPGPIPAPWTHHEEVAEEQKREVDRRQAYLLREQKKAERRSIKQHREREIVEAASQVPRHISIPMMADARARSASAHPVASIETEEKKKQAKQHKQHKQQQPPPKMMHSVVPIHANEEDIVDEEARRAEQAELKLRIRPSLQQLHAPILTTMSLQDEIVAQSRNKVQRPLHKSSSSNNINHHRLSVRAPSLSPPESPLTSASEVSEDQQYRRPKTAGRFLVESRKNSLANTVLTSTTQRSVSDASSMTFQHRHRQGLSQMHQQQHGGAGVSGQAQMQNKRQYPQSHPHHFQQRQRADRCVSEQRCPPHHAM